MNYRLNKFQTAKRHSQKGESQLQAVRENVSSQKFSHVSSEESSRGETPPLRGLRERIFRYQCS